MNIIGLSGLHHSVSFKKKMFPNLSPRDYRIAQGFDSAAALVTPRGIRAAAAEERFTGHKGTGAFPVKAITYCLQAENLSMKAIDYIAHGFDYQPFQSFYQHDPLSQQQYNQVYAPQVQRRCLQQHFPNDDLAGKYYPVPHHLAHAASTFYPSGFNQALILITDAMGEIHSTTLAVGRPTGIEIIKQITAPHSLGILYGVFTLYLGFVMSLDEYKVMGLAPYGNPNRYFNQLMAFINLKNDGTYTIPLLFENQTTLEKETYRRTLHHLAHTFGPAREPGAEITQHHKDLAAALQAVLQATLLHLLRHFKKETGQTNLCMAGGVALNCTANGAIHRSRLFKNIFIQPAAGDDGTALGAALYLQHQHQPPQPAQKMALPLWGPAYSPKTVARTLQDYPNCTATRYNSFDTLAGEVVQHLARGQVVAWFQGRMEFGPRALGNRSILADPRDPAMQDHLNQLIKQREDFRPFAPAVTQEAAAQYFELAADDADLYAYMLFVTQVRAEYRHHLPAITHIDGSARLQVVTKNDNLRFWTLLHKFGQTTGTPVLLNTSFNLRGQPIICTPTEAINTFLKSEIDLLVIEDFVITRANK